MAIHRTNFKSLDDGFMYVEYAGTHDDTKPVYDGLATGSLFIEVDTGDVYFYNEDSSSWVKAGGSDD